MQAIIRLPQDPPNRERAKVLIGEMIVLAFIILFLAALAGVWLYRTYAPLETGAIALALAVTHLLVIVAAFLTGISLSNASWSEEWQRRKQIDKSWKDYNQDHFRNH